MKLRFIPVQYDKVKITPSGVIVYKNEKKGLYSREGKLLLPVEYDSLEVSSDRKDCKPLSTLH